jgi:hypothetical protein
METTRRRRICNLALFGYAVCGLAGMVLPPIAPDTTAGRLSVLADHAGRADLTYAFRMTGFLLLAPALVAILSGIRRRGAALAETAAVLLAVSGVAGAGFVSLMAVEMVLARVGDRAAAVAAATLMEGTFVWMWSAVGYLLGWLLGSIVLGAALWRARTTPRWIPLCVGAGPVVHVAAGDLVWTTWGGALLVTAGLIGVAVTNRGLEAASPTIPDPDELMAADQPGRTAR